MRTQTNHHDGFNRNQLIEPARVYAPVRDARKNDFTIAAANGPIETYGVTAEGALASPGEITFGEFIRLPETLEMFGDPEVSNAAQLLLQFREAFQRDATRRMLIDFVQRRHTGRPRGFRYWNHLGASIWKIYVGVQGGKKRTAKAHGAEVDRYLKAARRAGKEVERSALRRKPNNPADALRLSVKKRQIRIDWLRRRAAKKRADVQALLRTVEALEAEAVQLETE